VQVDPTKPTLKAPGTQRLTLKYYKLLSSFAFKFDLRRYIKASLSKMMMRMSKREIAGAFQRWEEFTIESKEMVWNHTRVNSLLVCLIECIYLSVLYFKSNDQNPTVNPPFRPPEGAQLKRP